MKTNALRKNATTLALVGVAGLLAAYVLLVDRGTPSTEESTARKKSLLPIFRDKDISKIELVINGHRATLTKKAGEASLGAENKGEQAGLRERKGWTIEADGSSAPADNEAVADLLRGLGGARRLRDVPSSVGDDITGLSKPRVEISLDMGALSYHVLLGNKAASPKGAVYAKVEGQPVAVVSKRFVSSMAKSIDAYRSRRIVTLLMDDVSRLTITDHEGTRRLVRAKWGFRVGGALGPRASSTMLERVTEAMADMTAKAFLPVSQAKELVDKDALTLRLSPIDKTRSPVVLRLGGVCPKHDSGASKRWIVALRTEPTPVAACVPRSVLDPLRPRPEAFIDTHLLAGRPSEVYQVTVRRGEQVLELARRGHGWHQRRPSDRELSSDEGDTLVKGLLNLEGRLASSEKTKPSSWSAPRGSVTIQLAAPEGQPRPTQQILVGARDGTSVWIKRKQDGAVLQIGIQSARLLQASPVLLRSVQLMNSATVHMRSVQVSVRGKPWQKVARAEVGFKLSYPPGYDVDAGLTTNLFHRLAQLRAVRWVADKDDGSFGLAHPWARISFSLSNDGHVTTKKMLVGTVSRDGRYARWEPDTGVFVLAHSVVRDLTRYVIDRSAFMVDPSTVKQVELRSASAKLIVSTSGETWAIRDDKGHALAEHLASGVQEALQSMQSEGVVHIGASRAEEGLDSPLVTVTVEPKPGEHARRVVWHIGRGDVWQKANVFYARRDDIDATFALARSRVMPLMEALGLDTERR